MKRGFFIAIFTFFLSLALAGTGQAQTTGHQLKFLGKFLWGYSDRNSSTLWPGQDEFTTTLLDLKVQGMASEHVSYCLEFATSYHPERNLGSFNGPGNPGEVGSVGVRRFSLTFHDLLPWTKVEVGTFIPPLGNYLPRELSDLDLIQYPLMFNGRFLLTSLYGNHPPVRDLAPWQQAGINVTVQTPYFMKMQFGYWDGTQPNWLANTNPTPGKAGSFILTFDPNPQLSLSAGVWNEEFQQAFPGHARGARRNLTMWYLYGSYKTEVLEITADYAQGIVPKGQLDNSGEEFKDLVFEGYQITVGYWITPQFEALVRYERFDPNSIDSVQVAASRYDASRWLTFGLNYKWGDQAELSVNYVVRTELAPKIDQGEPGEDPRLPGYNPKYASQRNGLLLVQFMFWQ